jgi:hypothetical protein
MGSLAEGMEFIGDRSIWELPKTAFLCSRKVPAAQVLKCYDWAIAMREAGQCVMLGAHSPLEKDVLHYLLKGTQPVVLVLARSLLKRMDPVLQAEVDKGRLLVVAPFAKEVRRVTQETADARNAFMLAHAQAVVVGHVAPDGQLASALANLEVQVTWL